MWTKVQQVIEYSQNLDEAYIEDLKSKWEVNKKFFLDAVGGPIWESDEVITFPLDSEHLYRTLNDLIDRVAEYDAYAMQRLLITPGLTCYWQIQPNRNRLSFAQWVDLDVKYIRERSFLTDWKIILKTFGAVLGMNGE